MLYWAIYDISEDRLRNRVAEKCKDYGLTRLQKSAFFGELNRNSAEMLAVELEDMIGKEKSNEDDCVFILPMCNSCIAKKITIGKGFDEKEFEGRFYTFFG